MKTEVGVKNIKDLKREIVRRGYPNEVLGLINSLEAEVKARIKICDDLVEQLKRDGEKWEYHPARVEALALRKVLDRSEEG